MKFKFHNIIWAKYDRTPEYLWNLTAADLEQWAYNYIDTIQERYGDQLDIIDVINEQIADTKSEDYHDAPWYIIDDFACKMFKYTKSKFPNSVLLYNDYAFESATGDDDRQGVKNRKVYDYVKGLVDGECGIDGVGFQSHYMVSQLVNETFMEGMAKNIKQYKDLGLKVHFSEISNKCDVDTYLDKSCKIPWSETTLDQ